MKKFITLMFILSLTVLVGNSSYANVKPDIIPTVDVFTNDHVSPLFYDVNMTKPPLFFAGLDGYTVVSLSQNDSIIVDNYKLGVDMRSYSGSALIIVEVSAPRTGTNPTLSVIIKTSSDNFVADSTTIKTFTGVTSTKSSQSYFLNVDEQKRYWRVVYDIGGTATPKYWATTKIVAKKKYL